jgi:hypothetical protein
VPKVFKAGFPATLFSVVLATVMVGSGLLFDRMAAVAPQPAVRVALMDRVPPARVEPVAPVAGELGNGRSALATASPPMRLALRNVASQENAPVRAQARRGEKKKEVPSPVFGPQSAAESLDDETGLRP